MASRPNFLLPVKVLGRLFRGKYLDGLRQAYVNGELQLAGSTAELADPGRFHKLLSTLYAKDWVVYSKKPFAGPATLLKYLAAYTHRVALSNPRLVKLSNDRVTLTYKDYANGCQRKEMTLAAVELLRRFALHVVPGITRIRHYGLLAHRDRGARLAKCRALLAAAQGVAAGPVSEAPLTATAASKSAPAGPAAGGASLGVVLAVAVLGSAVSAATATTAATMVHENILTDDLCPVCRQGRLEVIWCKNRPTGRDFERAYCWNTS